MCQRRHCLTGARSNGHCLSPQGSNALVQLRKCKSEFRLSYQPLALQRSGRLKSAHAGGRSSDFLECASGTEGLPQLAPRCEHRFQVPRPAGDWQVRPSGRDIEERACALQEDVKVTVPWEPKSPEVALGASGDPRFRAPRCWTRRTAQASSADPTLLDILVGVRRGLRLGRHINKCGCTA